MKENLIHLISDEKLIPIIRCKNANKVTEYTKALIDGGVKIVEITVETPEIYRAIQDLSKDITICAGGIITSLQAQTAIDCGAKILASPIFQSNLLKFSKDKHVPYIAGTSTANEAYNAWKSRIPLVKIYPITPMGGTAYIKNILRPMPFLNLIPSGSVKLSEVKDYIKAGATAVGVGRDIFDGYSYNEITNRIANTLEELKGI